MARRASPHSPFRSGLEPFDIPMVQAQIADDAEGAEGGIGLRHVEHPLLVRLARPDGTPVDTAFELHWGPGSPVAFNTLQTGDENLLYIPFIVASDKILEGLAYPIYVVIKRPSDNPTETRKLCLRVNLQRPGGRDSNPLPGNQNLNFELPLEVVLNGVDDLRARAGVEVTVRYWQHMAAYDLLRLVWGSQIIERLIQPDEVNRDITLTVPYETILEAGDSEILPCAFQVIGPTGNFPDPWEPWSEVVHLSVYLQTDRLDAPWVEFPVTEGEIDLVPLGDRDVKIGVYVSSQDARDYSHLFLTWAGKNDQGGSVPHTDSLELASSARFYSFDIPNALVAAIAKGSAVVFYTLESSEKPAKRSHNRHITVIGDVVRLPAPTVDEALADYLDPNLSKATIRFPAQLNWQASDWLQVVILSVGADNPVEYVDSRVVGEIPPGGEMTFEVPGVELKRFDKRVIEVLYTLTHGTELSQDSQRRVYQVGEPVRDMPAPDVEKALGGQLNPDDVLNGAKVTALFAQTKANDWITLYWSGRVSALPIRVQVPEDGKVMVFEVLYQYIEPNLNGGVSVFYTLERDGQPMRYSKLTGLLIGRGLGELPPPALAKASVTGPGTATLAPLNAQGGSELVVSYDGMLDSDSITVIMSGTTGAGSPNIPAKPGNAATGRVVFDITKAAIAANIGNVNKTVIFKYVVTRNGVPKDSQTLTVTVTPIPQASLPRPLINRIAHNGTLDTMSLTTDPSLTIGSWPFQVAGMKVWMTYHCAGANPNPNSIWRGYVYPSASGVNHYIQLSWLKTCPNGSQLSIDFKVEYGSNVGEAGAVSLPRTVYTIKAIPLADPPCSSAGYFRSVFPGKYYQCVWHFETQRWQRLMYSCGTGQEFDPVQQRCVYVVA